MDLMKANCVHEKVPSGCDAYAHTMKKYFNRHKEAAIEMKQLCTAGHHPAACSTLNDLKTNHFRHSSDL